MKEEPSIRDIPIDKDALSLLKQARQDGVSYWEGMKGSQALLRHKLAVVRTIYDVPDEPGPWSAIPDERIVITERGMDFLLLAESSERRGKLNTALSVISILLAAAALVVAIIAL